MDRQVVVKAVPISIEAAIMVIEGRINATMLHKDITEQASKVNALAFGKYTESQDNSEGHVLLTTNQEDGEDHDLEVFLCLINMQVAVVVMVVAAVVMVVDKTKVAMVEAITLANPLVIVHDNDVVIQ